MSKKQLLILAVAMIAVAGFYLYLFRDSFRKASIHISHTIRPRTFALTHPTAGAGPGDDINMVAFRLDQTYRLTDIKVVPIPELETNKYAHPIWELNSDSNSAPMSAFFYGRLIRGMKPSVKGAQAGELAPNVPYRLYVQAGKLSGEHDFTITEENRLAH
jgi:hypothetical protein